jgi:hypothetical protein
LAPLRRKRRAAREEFIMRHVSTTLAVLLLLAGVALASGVNDVATLSDPPVNVPSGSGPLFFMPTEVLYDNGPFMNSPGTGVGGADESILQTNLGLGTYGFGHQVYYGYIIADDFTVPAGETWDIEQITFFAYQTNSGNTSTITAVHFEIWDGPPNAGGTTIFGDMTTNRMVSTGWTGVYRVTDYNSGIDSARPVMGDVCSPMGILQLTEGTYWLLWQTDGTLSSGPWAPPITITGQTATGNALQYTTAWAAALDGSYQQGFPFIIEGTRGPVGVEATTWSMVKTLYR